MTKTQKTKVVKYNYEWAFKGLKRMLKEVKKDAEKDAKIFGREGNFIQAYDEERLAFDCDWILDIMENDEITVKNEAKKKS